MIEMSTSPSKNEAGKWDAVVTGDTPTDVQLGIEILTSHWPVAEFTLPAKGADGRYVVKGRVWHP